jgi:D-lactate dehydrogenase
VVRERERLRQTGEDDERLEAMSKSFVDAALDTCAACNLCSTVCPVGIETGTMVMGERAARRKDVAGTIASVTASSLGMVETMMGAALGAQDFARNTIGDNAVDFLGNAARKICFDKLPRPSPSLGRAPGGPKDRKRVPDAPRGEIVYFPSCASRLFSGGDTHLDLLSVPDAMVALLKRAGYDPVVPKHLAGKCCGQPFLSKGFPDKSKQVGDRLNTEMRELGSNLHPYVTDASTCASHMRSDGIAVHDSAEFLLDKVLPYLDVTTPLPVVAVHHNCSAQRMKEQPATEALASACARRISVLTSITCCGYAGDKGLFKPDLNDHALRFVKNDIPADCTIGVSTVSTCATGLSDHAGIPFVGIASLLEYVTRPKAV